MPTSERFIENEVSFGFALFQEAKERRRKGEFVPWRSDAVTGRLATGNRKDGVSGDHRDNRVLQEGNKATVCQLYQPFKGDLR